MVMKGEGETVTVDPLLRGRVTRQCCLYRMCTHTPLEAAEPHCCSAALAHTHNLDFA
jgi:hypothetical protein